MIFLNKIAKIGKFGKFGTTKMNQKHWEDRRSIDNDKKHWSEGWEKIALRKSVAHKVRVMAAVDGVTQYELIEQMLDDYVKRRGVDLDGLVKRRV